MGTLKKTRNQDFAEGFVDGFIHETKRSEPYRRLKLKTIATAFIIVGLLVAIVATSAGISDGWLVGAASVAIGMLIWKSANKYRQRPS